MHSSSYATLARSTENVLAETSSALPPRHAGSAPCRPQFPRCRTARNTRRVTAIFGIGWTLPGRNDDVLNLGRTQSADKKLVVVAGVPNPPEPARNYPQLLPEDERRAAAFSVDSHSLPAHPFSVSP